MQIYKHPIESSNTIEYLGVNVLNSQVTNVKKYYIWDGREFPVDPRMLKLLKPFDFGLRNNGAVYSVSSFVKDVTIPRMHECVSILRDKYGMRINDDSISEFLQFQQIPKGIHYDPIVSFKYKNGIIEGTSLYVTALKDKSLVLDYMEHTISLLLDSSSMVVPFIKKVVESRYADMFQIAWDFDQLGLIQHKIYLKIKQLDYFLIELKQSFPELIDFVRQEGFRFCELAFVIKNKTAISFNLYFKPL